MSQSGRRTSVHSQASSRRLKQQPSFSSSSSGPLTEGLVTDQSISATQEPPKSNIVVSAKYGIHVAQQRNKAALQKLANTFVEINKRKVEKRDSGQNAWRNLIRGVLDLQKGKIPLLLAVEAGNQSMCRELLSAQTTEQLKVTFSLNAHRIDFV